MSSQIRVLVAAPDAHVLGVAHHMRELQDADRTVLLLTADRPFAHLSEALRKHGVDPEAVTFIDAVTCMDGNLPAQRPANVVFLQSPTMLEMMAMRVEQMFLRMTSPHVVVDSLSTLALYNGIPPVQEFSHYLANRLRTHAIPGDFVVRANQAGQELHDRIRGFTDDALHIGGAS